MTYPGQLTTLAFTAMTLRQFLLCRGALALHMNPVPLVSNDVQFFIDYTTPLDSIRLSLPWKATSDVKLLIVSRGNVDTIYPTGIVTFRSLWSVEFAYKDYTLGAPYNNSIMEYMFHLLSFANTRGIQTPLPPGSEKTREILQRYCTPSVNLMRRVVGELIEKGG